MLDDLEVALINISQLESRLRAAQLTLWDRFFVAALAATLCHGKVTGVNAAAEIADEALRVRNKRAGI